MYRKNFSPNPYNQSVSFNGGEVGFKSPMPQPLFHSSPRYQQQFNPHHSGHNGNNNCSRMEYTPGRNFGSPNFRSPRSPHHSSFEHTGSPFSDRSSNNSSNINTTNFSGHSASPSSLTYHNRSRNNMGKSRSNTSREIFSSRYEGDCNPGGSKDIQAYYKPTMLKDPWAGLSPVPVSVTSPDLG